MAYKNLVAEAIASRAEVFKRIRDWICKRNGSYDYSVSGLGWTLHDSSYATNENSPASNDYFVIKSTGESGKEDLYFKITYSSTSGNIQIQMFQYWNNSTHAGVNGQTAANNLAVTESASGTLYIYGNLDYLFIGTIIGASIYGCLFGIVDDSVYDRTIAASSSSVSAGSNVVVTLDNVPSSWVVGGKVVVRDNTNIERITISAISGNDVTFTSISASYAAGCKFAKDYPVICQNSTNMSSTFICMFGHNGSKLQSVSLSPSVLVPGNSGDPDPAENEYMASRIDVGNDTVGYLGGFTNILAIPATGFAHLSVYTTAEGVNYRAFISFASSAPLMIKEVS